ncbi:hypothetical protein CHU95_17920 [Niveispirillum lacus]|uniref:N-acetylmuramoyl-L-alanine amidase n=2 Tax=Niveispirillum lacus TaxID=1981099 RepID=A0A255YUT6_9PROT|nr:hypothetical protein CHU95_17920 [Niveispirillum lacus]
MLPAPARIGAARLGDHGDKTRFVLELTRDTPFAILPDSQGVTVEMEAALDAPLPAAKGLVRAIAVRPGASPGQLRLILSTSAPVRVLLAEVIPPRDGMPPRFVMDLAAGVAGKGSAMTPVSAGTLKPPMSKEKAKPSLPLVVIDPGHGGQDPGAIALNGLREKDITLAMAKELRRQLLATGRYRVALTRDKDQFIPLRDRPAIARTKGADLFISLHADSITGKQVRGLSIYTLSEKASDREAEMLAQRENQSDAIVGMDLSVQSADIATILIGMSQRDTMNQSRRFASLVLRNLDPSIAVLPSPLRSAGFAVLTAPDVPAVLVEMGYLSHSQDAKLLGSDAHRRRMAGSLLRAVDGYFTGNAVPLRP